MIIFGCIWLCLVEIVQQSGEEVSAYQCLVYIWLYLSVFVLGVFLIIFGCAWLILFSSQVRRSVLLNAMSQLQLLCIHAKCSVKRSLNLPITCLNPQPLPWHGLDNLFAGLSQDPRVPRWRSHQQWLLGVVRFLARYRQNI